MSASPLTPGVSRIGELVLGFPVQTGNTWVWHDPRIPGGQVTAPVVPGASPFDAAGIPPPLAETHGPDRLPQGGP